MSFFDEADEPEETPRSEPRRSRPAARQPRGGSGRPPRGSGRPPGGRQHQQEVQQRRLIAVGVIVVIVIAMALLIAQCSSNQNKNSIKNYNADVYRLMNASYSNGVNLFGYLTDGDLTSSGILTLENDLAKTLNTATEQLDTARSYSPPGQLASTQTALVQVMQLREQGISEIANNIQKAAAKTTSKDGVRDITVGTSLLYASDVMYKTFVATGLAKALNGAGIPIGSGNGEQPINSKQILTDLGWVQSTFVAEKIGAQLSTNAANANNAAPGLHGHSLDSVSVGSTTLSTVDNNTIPASPAPTFTLNITNGGDFNEYQVECQVSIVGLSDTGTATLAETRAHQSTSCSVTLPFPPTAGQFQVTARVLKVPGEKNLTNNALTFPVTFN